MRRQIVLVGLLALVASLALAAPALAAGDLPRLSFGRWQGLYETIRGLVTIVLLAMAAWAVVASCWRFLWSHISPPASGPASARQALLMPFVVALVLAVTVLALWYGPDVITAIGDFAHALFEDVPEVPAGRP
jgi:hypothetical protein